jgi:anthranilate phosphoribosyltransferase
MLVQDVLRKLTAGENLTAEEAYNLIVAIKNDQLSSVQIAGFQVALLMKGPTLEEITAIAKAMRDNCETISPQVDSELLDTCGTGGGLSTFNISTAVAIVAAAAGIPVAKHGSRSISNLSGSADVLEALGVEINLLPRDVEKLIEEIGIAFIYAPLFHPVMHKVLTPEQELGIKTIFYTIIGPLINPARATRHILGVYKAELLDIVAQIALSLGYTRGMFVHGVDGMDEISLLGKTRVNEIHKGSIISYEIAPEDFGFSRCSIEDICTGTPEMNAAVIRRVFSGKDKGSRCQAIILNAAGALLVGEKANTFKEGIEMAAEIIASGQADKKLQQLITASRDIRSA